ncbi:MAG TPA: NUDIX hydrolase [Nocardioidaceae bacterium]|nr:NUDIX hydrolase [Nocardioidaceae bacterium]
MTERQPVPPNLVDDAEAYLTGDRSPVEPKPASTVVLIRDGEHGIDVYLLRRHAGMAFAAGMYAFPGGRVDPRDDDAEIGWGGPAAADWAARLGCSEPAARALVCAAVRETFEESGVLLAGPGPDDIVGDTRGPDWEADRAALVDRSLPFTTFIARRGLVLRTDLLGYWAHWITPEFEPRRYDTRFFVARMPSGQLTRDVSGEADRADWMATADALGGIEDGSMAMLPPTSMTIRQVATHRRVADVLQAARHRAVNTVRPGVALLDGQPVFTDIDDMD